MSIREFTSKLPLEDRRKRFVGAEISKAYRKYRLNCDPELIEEIISYTREKLPCKLTRALDVGCGTGQCTSVLAPYFDEVLGIDASPTQIQEALDDPANQAIPNISFKVGFAEELPFEDNSVQLVTAAASFHWFDREAFVKEVKRVLVPNGVLAICSAGRESFVSDDPELKAKVLETEREFWTSQFGINEIIPDVLKAEKMFPKDDTELTEFKDHKQVNMALKGSSTLAAVLNKIPSTSFYQSVFENDKERGQAAIDDLTKKYLTILKSTESAEDCVINVERHAWYSVGRA